jgi:hypothetical protein
MSLPELQDGAQSKQKAEYVSHTLSKRGKSDYIELTYKRLDGPNPGAESKTGNFVTALDEASRNLIKAKGEFVVVKTKDGKFWPLTGIQSMDTYVVKAPSTFQKGTYSGGSSKTTGSTFNNAGIKVGAVLHDAVALAGIGATTAKVKTIAEELLNLSYELEANVNAGKYEPKGSTASTSTQAATKVAEVEEDIGLDNIDF